MGSFYFQAPRVPDKMGRGAMVILGLFALVFFIPILFLLAGGLLVAGGLVVDYFCWTIKFCAGA
ncbi:MAG: hypothetical protein ACLQLG_19900 [Thermoguttaceae bacterium]